MKGKIGLAMETGVPVVTTSIGAEGFPVTDWKECFIADEPQEFGLKCNRCLADPAVWYQFIINAMEMISENFSEKVVGDKLKGILNMNPPK